MLDPSSAIGLVASVIQLVTFTSSIVSKSREVYNSAEGALVEQMELETVTQSLKGLIHDMQKRKFSILLSPGGMNVSNELLSTLESLKVQGNRKKWNSFRQALNSVWNERKFEELENPVNRYRSQINTTLLLSLRRCRRKERETRQALHILETLRFPHMADRHEETPIAYQRRFSWVLREPERQNEAEHPDDEIVPEWDSFVEWLNGNENSTGLPENPAFPDRWRSYQVFGGDLNPLSWIEVSHALRNLVSDAKHRFLFFVDGLDEFDGNYSELADPLVQVSSGKNVKICTACRPWLVFEEEFEGRPRLRLENLCNRVLASQRICSFTLREAFVGIHFRDSEGLRSQEAQQLIGEVIDKASRVFFFWVYLVVNSLLEGVRDGDDIPDLQERLLALPSDIEKLVDKILSRLDPLYFKSAAKLFRVFHTAMKPTGPLTLLTLYLSKYSFDKAIHATTRPIPGKEAHSMAETMRRRLNSRCRVLLEVPRYHSNYLQSRVGYLHRTVKDYLEKLEVWGRILTSTPSFDENEALCRSFLLHIKGLELDTTLTTLNVVWSAVTNIITYADTTQLTLLPDKVAYLDELDRTATAIFQMLSTSPEKQETWLERISRKNPLTVATSHWTNTQFVPGQISGLKNWRAGDGAGIESFFRFCFRTGLHWFIEYKLDQEEQLAHCKIDRQSLLSTATQLLHVPTIKLLLDRGADPNRAEGCHTLSPWQLLLSTVQSFEDPPTISEAVKLFLDHNADRGARVHGSPANVLIKCALDERTPEDSIEELSLKPISAREERNYDRGKPSIVKRGEKGTKSLISRFAAELHIK
ncbi:hypothetical protein K469DRAFT_688947 [Zopfia rhizophila CBS 207.26]|uniref:DUF7791 domain-containing protein n=1 Tax=Zopfia rhizophila CBS 207.26 TaxID=1314779 RepID=A0A6A6DY53_9PEZI|nr:hypothetical protein K469DRAFT_688947 [Zopfia rhizophila CBS 207.26]